MLHILTTVNLWCSLDNNIIIWDPAKGQRLHTLEGHNSYVKGIAWDPIGKYLASQSDDRTVKVGVLSETGTSLPTCNAGAGSPRNAPAEVPEHTPGLPCHRTACMACHATEDLQALQTLAIGHAMAVHLIRKSPCCMRIWLVPLP